MAITAATQWECRDTATAGNVNGGGFDSTIAGAGTDWSMQDAAQYPLAGVATAGAGATFLLATASADMVGNIAHVISGVNFTPGWYQIISINAGVDVTVDRALATGIGANGAINIGGAMSLGSALDDEFFDSLAAGNTCWIRNGNYTLGEAVSPAISGTAALPTRIIGYASARGDNPVDSTAPFINFGAFGLTIPAYWGISYIRYTGTATNIIITGLSNKIFFCRGKNTSTTGGRSSINLGNNNILYGGEYISYRGQAIITSFLTTIIYGVYVHHSNIGIFVNDAGATVIYTLIEACITAAVQSPFAGKPGSFIFNSSLIGTLSKRGTGLANNTGATVNRLSNNLIWGFVTGVSFGDSQLLCLDEYNDYFNNTTDITNGVKGATDLAIDPQFANVGLITGSTATTAGGILTQIGADFSNVVDGVDYIYIVSGTGVTAGYYGILNHTINTITPDIAFGNNAVANKVFEIVTGHDYKSSGGLRAVGFPGTLINSQASIGKLDIGAIQSGDINIDIQNVMIQQGMGVVNN